MTEDAERSLEDVATMTHLYKQAFFIVLLVYFMNPWIESGSKKEVFIDIV